MQINVTSQKPMGQGEEIEVIAAGVPKLPPRNTHRPQGQGAQVVLSTYETVFQLRAQRGPNSFSTPLRAE
jgi:hypothetical protein